MFDIDTFIAGLDLKAIHAQWESFDTEDITEDGYAMIHVETIVYHYESEPYESEDGNCYGLENWGEKLTDRLNSLAVPDGFAFYAEWIDGDYVLRYGCEVGKEG